MMEFKRQEEASRAYLRRRETQQCFKKVVRMNQTVSILSRRDENGIFPAKSCFSDEKEKRLERTNESQIRISYYSNKKYIHTEI